MAETLGFAVIGCGVIGLKHAEEISRIADAKLVAVTDSVLERAKSSGETFGVEWYQDFRQMLKRPDIQIVNICTPSGMHADFAVEVAKAGKHVIVEKPIDIAIEKADAMIEACKEAGVKLCVISQHRFDPATARVKASIEEGKLGQLFLAEAAVNWYRSQGYYDSGDWRGTWAFDGGGALMNQSIHTIDVLQYLMGPIESVHAYMGTKNHERIEVEDVAVAIARFRNGGMGTIAGTTAAYPGLSTRLEIFGTNGSAVIESDQLTHLYQIETPVKGVHHRIKATNLAQESECNKNDTASTPAISAHRFQFQDMIDAVRSNREPLVNGIEGRKSLEIILAIYKSAQTGETVYLPLN
ncbi:Gfo/Idh/MocA family oxidoreductase [Fodinisporobacter ferrooxydans]|uniref:Gfo/Idh/MocA family oxidoreductase n=1 Tax=Fodinisporobacter ferrooxydans TaxID=2901836 RepID=A0ABY4CGL3_9BACL|nr:Gfo/Idh/MocA family oxidoreductase [Alicyclobacillaceae bacterium MYW30-H2]